MANKKSTTKKKTTAKKTTASSAKSSVAKSTAKPKTSSSGSTSKTTTKKSGSGLIWGAIIAALVVIVGVVVAVLCLNRSVDPSDPTAMLDYSKSFFIYDNAKYSLWNADGKRVTEDEYQNQSSFVGGYAMVKKDDQYGIINENGQLSVDYGKYGSITSQGGLYLAEDGNTKEKFLITGAGKVLEKGNELDVETASSTSGFAVVRVDNKVKIYNYAGTLIAEADVVEGEDEPTMNSMKDFGVVHYGDQNWIFDVRDGKLIDTFSGERFTFDSVADDRSMILLESFKDSDKFKLVANNKIYELNETKHYGLTSLNHVIGYDNYDELALLNSDYKVARRVNTYVQLKDSDNFAEEKKDGGVTIYYKGQIAKEFGEDAGIAVSGLLYNDLYAIKENDKVKFYNLDGSVAFEKEFEDVDVLSDMHNHAIVAEVEDEYYLIDDKGNRVGEVIAEEIIPTDGGYKAMNSKGDYAILDKNGKKVTDFKYDEVYYRSTAKPRNMWTAKLESGTSDVIDVDNNKVVKEGVTIDTFYDNYFTVKKDNGDIEYYTLDGELFYTKEKKSTK